MIPTRVARSGSTVSLTTKLSSPQSSRAPVAKGTSRRIVVKRSTRRRSAEVETLKGLRKLGVRLSLDHFGVGDVSFESLA